MIRHRACIVAWSLVTVVMHWQFQWDVIEIQLQLAYVSRWQVNFLDQDLIMICQKDTITWNPGALWSDRNPWPTRNFSTSRFFVFPPTSAVTRAGRREGFQKTSLWLHHLVIVHISRALIESYHRIFWSERRVEGGWRKSWLKAAEDEDVDGTPPESFSEPTGEAWTLVIGDEWLKLHWHRHSSSGE